MLNWIQKMNIKISRFMYGRYGLDELGKLFTISGFVLAVLSIFPYMFWLLPFSVALIVMSYVRFFSRKIHRRKYELTKYLMLKARLVKKKKLIKRRFAERKTHKYFKCKSCKTQLRVPRGKGKIAITCPKCHARVVKKT